jgi:pterin-4a-carbinolamine dehydratase
MLTDTSKGSISSIDFSFAQAYQVKPASSMFNFHLWKHQYVLPNGKICLKVLGWRLLDEEVGLKLQCLWKLRDFKCGVELVNRIYKVTESCGHFPDVHLEQNQVRAELWTESLGKLQNHSQYSLSWISLLPELNDLFESTWNLTIFHCRRLEHDRFHCRSQDWWD